MRTLLGRSQALVIGYCSIFISTTACFGQASREAHSVSGPATEVRRHAEIVTTDGRVYRQVTVEKVEPDGLSISFEPEGGGLGVARVKFRALPQHLQAAYGYDAQKAASYEAYRQANDAELQKRFWAEYYAGVSAKAQERARGNPAKGAEPSAAVTGGSGEGDTQHRPVTAPLPAPGFNQSQPPGFGASSPPGFSHRPVPGFHNSPPGFSQRPLPSFNQLPPPGFSHQPLPGAGEGAARPVPQDRTSGPRRSSRP